MKQRAKEAASEHNMHGHMQHLLTVLNLLILVYPFVT